MSSVSVVDTAVITKVMKKTTFGIDSLGVIKIHSGLNVLSKKAYISKT
jgi:hypothetical protein